MFDIDDCVHSVGKFLSSRLFHFTFPSSGQCAWVLLFMGRLCYLSLPDKLPILLNFFCLLLRQSVGQTAPNAESICAANGLTVYIFFKLSCGRFVNHDQHVNFDTWGKNDILPKMATT